VVVGSGSVEGAGVLETVGAMVAVGSAVKVGAGVLVGRGVLVGATTRIAGLATTPRAVGLGPGDESVGGFRRGSTNVRFRAI
jgi:UDP-3-O-[3-hydroxymyristoyl] glucosamine N-acyltransferase